MKQRNVFLFLEQAKEKMLHSSLVKVDENKTSKNSDILPLDAQVPLDTQR